MARRRILIRSPKDTGQILRVVSRRKERELFDAMMDVYRAYQKPDPGDYPVFFWPTLYPGVVTQAFGVNPQWYEPWGVPAHEGIDMKAPEGSDIYAAFGGVVSRNEDHRVYGHSIRIRSTIEGIIYEATYAHFYEPSPLALDTVVFRGSVIGKADSTGNSTGHHLHFHLKQFNGEKPDTKAQNKYVWPYSLIDCTPFFKELN